MMNSNNIGRFYNSIYWMYPIIDRFFLKQKKQVAHIINQLEHGTLLEIGIGSGSTLPFYTKHEIIGIDLSSKMLSIAKKKKTKVPVQLFIGDATQIMNGNATIDYVIINHVLAATNNPEQILKEAFRVLKPNGHLIILNHFTPKNLLGLIDYCFIPFTKLLRFRSYFFLSDLKNLNLFKIEYKILSKPFGYYQIVVLKK